MEYLLTFAALALVLLFAMFDSMTSIFLVAALYVLGAIWGAKLLRYLGINSDFTKAKPKPKFGTINSCGACGGIACERHRLLPHDVRLNVPRDFDSALEHLFEQLLQTYVRAWYSDFSSDEAFVQELRIAIATATRNIANRLLRVNTASVIFEHLIPVALHHAQDWRMLNDRARIDNGKPEDYVADRLGSKIHPAAYSREAELNYLRGLVTALMPLLSPASYSSTNNRVILREVLANWVLLPAMDALADPDNINTLIILSTYRESTLSRSADCVDVPLLRSWSVPPIIAQSFSDPLKPSLQRILNDPQLLFLFMQHIKETAPVNLLQFCLDVDDLGKRLMDPEMSTEVEESLHAFATKIYSTYLDPAGPDYLYLPLHIADGMKQILDVGPGRIQDLRTSKPLYEARREAHALLEATCLLSFHHSYELYKLICGQPTPTSPTKPSNQNSGTGSSTAGSVNRLSNQLGRFRGVLRATAIDGAPYQSQHVYQAEEVECSPRTYDDIDAAPEGGRDLSAWRVTVPHVDGGGAQPLYMVSVHSVAEEKSWTVLRRDVDFYALRARLIEFHGVRELNDSPLPTRKNQHLSLNTNRQRYQDFIQRLLSKPTLRSSELLHAFLTAPNLKPYFSNYGTPDIGVLYQNVAHKLRKERGQHLDKFMSTFLASANVKREQTDIGVEPPSDQNLNLPRKKGRDLLADGKFGNNLNLDPRIQSFPYVSSKRQHAKGACFCIAEAVDTLLDTCRSVARISWTIAAFSRRSLDPIIDRLFNKMLARLLSGGRAATVVKLLHATILGPRDGRKHSTSQTREEEKRYRKARGGLHSLLPWWAVCFNSSWSKLMDSLLEPLQNAALNKHLAYVLLDQLLADVFPELTVQR